MYGLEIDAAGVIGAAEAELVVIIEDAADVIGAEFVVIFADLGIGGLRFLFNFCFFVDRGMRLEFPRDICGCGSGFGFGFGFDSSSGVVGPGLDEGGDSATVTSTEVTSTSRSRPLSLEADADAEASDGVSISSSFVVVVVLSCGGNTK